MSKWKGAAAWSAKEARAGDRLPHARLVDESTLLLPRNSEEWQGETAFTEFLREVALLLHYLLLLDRRAYSNWR